MPPYHVDDDVDLYQWVVKSVRGAGAEFTTIGDFYPLPMNAGTSETVTMKFTPHVAQFADGSKLTMRFMAKQSSAAGWEYVTYTFDYRKADCTLVVRFDKHDEPWVEQRFGTKCHVHLRDNDPNFTFWSDEVEIDHVLSVILDYQQTGELRVA